MTRYALVHGAQDEREVAAYLPGNYRTLGYRWTEALRRAVVIEGRDVAGWTLDDYLAPRLASGLMVCEEIDLSHPAVRTFPLEKRPSE